MGKAPGLKTESSANDTNRFRAAAPEDRREISCPAAAALGAPMDLTPWTCRGLPGDFDRLMRDVPVAGIDRAQAHAMVRLCEQTEPVLYGPDFSPRRIGYHAGSRPALEAIAHGFGPSPAAAMEWVRRHVRHPHFAGHVAPDRALTEERLIDSGVGWCNEQCRVFVALCQVMGVPARLCFLFHANGKTAHTAAEAFVDGRWAFHDVTYGIRVALPDGTLAEGRQLCGPYRHLAHGPYRAPLMEYYSSRTPPFDLARGGDLLDAIGICNYVIEGAFPLS
jgi:hypothetical protein